MATDLLPPYSPPAAPPPLPFYKLPAKSPLPSTHRYCAECRCPKLRTEFRPIFADDPYGMGEKAVKKLFRDAKRESAPRPSEDRIRAVRAPAIRADPGATPLRTQPRCRVCDDLRSRRRSMISGLRKSLASMGHKKASLKVTSDFVSVEVAGAAQISHGVLEDLAEGGVVLVDETGAVRLPRDPAQALRICVVLLATDKYDGALGVVRAQVLQRVPELAALVAATKTAATPTKTAAARRTIVNRAADVVDVALVRHERGPLASVAMERLLSRHWRYCCRKANYAIRSGALDAHEASARLSEGIFHAARKWDPLHVKGTGFGTVAFQRAWRALSLRGSKDFAIGAVKGEDGLRHGSATSLEALSASSAAESSRVTPNAVSYSAGHSALRVEAMGRGESLRASVRHDVGEALGALSGIDRRIAEMLWTTLAKASVSAVAEAVGLTVSDVKARVRQIRLLLTVLLADYRDADAAEAADTGTGATEAEVDKLRQTLLHPPLISAAEMPKLQKQAGSGVLQRAVASISGKRAALAKETDKLAGLKVAAGSDAAVAHQELRARTATDRLVFVLNRWYEMVRLARKNLALHLAMRQKRADDGEAVDEVDAVIAKLKAVLAFGAQQAARGRAHAVRRGEKGFQPAPVIELTFDYRGRAGLTSSGAAFDIAAYVDEAGIAAAAEFVPARSAPPRLAHCSAPSAPSSFY